MFFFRNCQTKTFFILKFDLICHLFRVRGLALDDKTIPHGQAIFIIYASAQKIKTNCHHPFKAGNIASFNSLSLSKNGGI